ncbi:MAG: peptide deformylase [Desulfobacterales bacterium]|nr:peptide deformylase [Desulfobacterales bacterium]
MELLKILTYPDKFLKKTAKPVHDIDGSTQDIINKMAATMYAAPGSGLAATQVGRDMRIFVYDVAPPTENRMLQVIINPVIAEREGIVISEDEGCLSVLDFRANVTRSASILVQGLDREGNPMEIQAEGYLAIVLQHEIDHLNGTLFVDHVSSLKREMYQRRIQKQLRQK